MNVLLLIASFAFMELVAWSNHRFVMHGFLWRWHKDHHVNDHKRIKKNEVPRGFEKNDLFFLVYALPAILLMVYGFWTATSWAVFVAVGISLYGLTYFWIHDVWIHKRMKFPEWQPRSRYFRALCNAHEAHHHGKGKKDFSNYGLLIFQLRFLKM